MTSDNPASRNLSEELNAAIEIEGLVDDFESAIIDNMFSEGSRSSINRFEMRRKALLDAIARLSARPVAAEVTDAMVEAGAKAIYDLEMRQTFWAELAEPVRNRYRPEARKILEAAARVRLDVAEQGEK